MFKKLLLVASVAVATTSVTFAQATKEEKLKEKGDLHKLEQGWTKKAGLGLGMNQIGVINPRVGGANDQLGLNGVLTGAATYKMGRMAWDNVGTIQYGILKNGVLGAAFADIPFVKSQDNVVLASKFGYGITEKPVLFYSVAANFRTQLTHTYTGSTLSGEPGTRNSGFLAPAIFTIAPGLDYKPNDNFSVMFSPATFRGVIIGEERLAKLNTLGNTNGQAFESQIGASLNAGYKNDFFEKRVQFQTGLNLFSDYANLSDVKVDWMTATKVNIFKGFGIGLNTNLYYDKNVTVIAADKDAPLVPELPKGYKFTKERVQFIEGFFVTYDRTF
ncbi:MAG: hypothetical protein RI894_585 [Bacteroidota bacterium]|jgi:hypothetical protein